MASNMGFATTPPIRSGCEAARRAFYRGLRPGRTVQFTNDDHEEIRDGVPGVEHITSRFFIRGNLTVVYKGQTSSYNVRSVHPDHLVPRADDRLRGRFLNPSISPSTARWR